MPVLSLIVMAAGIGSRYGGLKQIDPIGPHGETLLDYSLFDAISVGFGKIVFVISQSVADTFLVKVNQTIGQHCEVEFVIQELANIPHDMSLPPDRKKPWGTGHAVLSCKQSIHGPFAVINADDYYGRSSFSVLQDFLTRIVDPHESTEYSMVVFWLDNTLTEHGHVARAICTLNAEGYVVELSELTHIERFEQTIRYEQHDGTWANLNTEIPVSMNMWGFTPSLFNELEIQFEEFMKDTSVDHHQAEFFLPEVIDNLLKEQKATVRALSTNERWFGITHQEDKLGAKNEINRLIQEGVYPVELWATR